jgi:hypothetical protein
MTPLRLLALVPLLLTGACALEQAGHKADDNAVVLTQVGPEPLATCIGQKFGVAASPAERGSFVIDAPGESPLRLLVARDDIQTVVSAPVGVIVPEAVASTVIQCTLGLTPPAKQE